MIKAVFEGRLEVSLSSDNALSAGQLVKLDTANAGKILATGAGDVAFGIVAQDVVAGNVDNFKLTSVTHKAVIGVDKVGVYHGGGIYLTDKYTGSVTVGQQLYAAAGGLLSATASGNPVAITESAGTAASGNVIRIKLLV